MGLLIKTVLGLGTLAMVYVQPYRPIAIVGRSMEPTYHNHSFVWTVPVQAKDLKDGDVVVIDTDKGHIIKRIALMPGDKYLQVKSAFDWFDLIGYHPRVKRKSSRNQYREVKIPSNRIYVLGDNPSVSLDSRSFGCIPIERVKYKLVDQRPRDYTAEWF